MLTRSLLLDRFPGVLDCVRRGWLGLGVNKSVRDSHVFDPVAEALSVGRHIAGAHRTKLHLRERESEFLEEGERQMRCGKQ